MLYQRTIFEEVDKFLIRKKAPILFIWGPRRSGKTTILEKLSKKVNAPIFNFDLISDREKFIPQEDILEKIAVEHHYILIDEVQNYPEGTLPIKILADKYQTKIIATGSSELRQKGAREFDSLAGRFEEIFCLPFSVEEIISNHSLKEYEKDSFIKNLQENLQIFGAYPEIYANKLSETKKINKLQKLIETYILKDIINIYDLKNAKLAKDVLTKIALQIGQEVSIREIASSLQANIGTISNYLEIFIKNYLLIPLPAFKTNLRRVVSANRKLYFFDLGIRNALVHDFRNTALRPDSGGVFENFIIIEFEKIRRIHQLPISFYFYREYQGKEVDLVIEDYKKRYLCLEIKKIAKKVNKIFPLNHQFNLIDQKNYWQILEQFKAHQSL